MSPSITLEVIDYYNIFELVYKVTPLKSIHVKTAPISILLSVFMVASLKSIASMIVIHNSLLTNKYYINEVLSKVNLCKFLKFVCFFVTFYQKYTNLNFQVVFWIAPLKSIVVLIVIHSLLLTNKHYQWIIVKSTLI